MKVACFSTKLYDRESLERLLPEYEHKFTYFDLKLDQHTVSLAKGYDAICSFVNDQLDKRVLNKLSKIDIDKIVLRSAGYNQVDLKKAAELGIKICRVPAYSPEAVAEHAVALLLTLSRKTHKAYNRIRENNFSIEGLTGFNINGKTVGVIGTGSIGSAFCRIIKGFGCKILAHDLFENKELKNSGVNYVSLEDLLEQSSIISLHCPLTEETKHLINKNTISLMTDGVTLLNTSRGGLIETKAVIEGLKKRKIGNLGIDVYEQEEHIFFQNLSEEILMDEDISRLMTFPNVLITGHQAFLTKEALTQISKVTLDNLDELENGGSLTNEVKFEEASK